MAERRRLPDLPTEPGPEFAEFLRKSAQIHDVKLAALIPRELFEPRLARGLLGFAVSATLYAGAVVGVAFVPHWSLYLPLWLVAGLGGWGLHSIAHDCGHGAFSRSRRLNTVIGQIALLPLCYPFHAWRHIHNLHHAHTNHLELDTDWRPIPAETYDRMPRHRRVLYRALRSWAVFGGTVNYWASSAFRPGFFPKRSMRRDVGSSILVVLAVLVPYLTSLTYFTGFAGLLRYFAAPWLVSFAWFSVATFMQHTARDIPFLPARHWTPNAGRLLVTTDYRYPRWLLFLTHNNSLHTAHHVAPIVPFYNLPRARAALDAAYPGMIRERRPGIRALWDVLRHCRYYDPKSGFYLTAAR
ncbi:MAG TPA: fatty acid desaturase, partial [Pseudonocardiaceae bacterium]|nr:fatty acid desaturase [Pseudonocardiaceae bacterium]